jgi:sugar-specific transcriptional regulator TrmB
MIDKETVLQQIGLPRNETKIYLTLLELGSTSVGQITKSSGIHRRNVYDSLERLIKKGLVTYVIKDKIKYFEAVNPSFLSNPLQIKKNSNTNENIAVVYEGINGVKSIFEDILNSKKENLVLGAHKPSQSIKNYLERFHKKRIKVGIKEKLLFFNKSDMKRARSLSKLRLTKVRFLPNNSGSKVAINIYGNKVAMLMRSEPEGFIIKNEFVAENFREYFKLLWKNSKEISKIK